MADEEQKLLVAAVQGGELYIISNQYGRWVQVGDVDFKDNSDPAYATKYLEALESLYVKRYVSRESDVCYRLKVSGWEKARKLAKTSGN